MEKFSTSILETLINGETLLDIGSGHLLKSDKYQYIGDFNGETLQDRVWALVEKCQVVDTQERLLCILALGCFRAFKQLIKQ